MAPNNTQTRKVLTTGPMKFLFIAVLVLVASIVNAVDSIPIKVVGVTDGDTIKAIINGFETRIRLYGIDAPEKAQSFGQVATSALKQAITGHAVTVQAIDQDRYGRPVALVFADGTNINEIMVRSGNAWVYRQYCREYFCRSWSTLEATAREAKLGLWQEEAEPPWNYRKKKAGH